VDREGLKTVRRAELLARLGLLDELIKEQASRAAFVREKGWDATVYEKRSKLLEVTRQQYLVLLKELLSQDPVRDNGANDDGT
jgi:hypothetical protein